MPFDPDDYDIFEPDDTEAPKPCPHLRSCASMPGMCPGRAACPMEDESEEEPEE